MLNILVTREKQIKTMRYHYTPVERLTMSSVRGDLEEPELSNMVGEMQSGSFLKS